MAAKKKTIFKRTSKGLRPLLFSFLIFSGVIGFFVFLFFIHDMPDLEHLETKGRRASIVFESYDGKNIATYGDLFKNVVTVDTLPKHVSNAVIAIEDHRFYHHKGAMWAFCVEAVKKR